MPNSRSALRLALGVFPDFQEAGEASMAFWYRPPFSSLRATLHSGGSLFHSMPRISLAGTLIVSALGAVTLTETSVLEMAETSPETGRSRLRLTVSAARAGN